jgi:hypothetical protein
MKAHYFGRRRNGVVSVVADRFRIDSGHMIPRLDAIFMEGGPVYSCSIEFEDGGPFTIPGSVFRVFYSRNASTPMRPASVREVLVFRGYFERQYVWRQLWSVNEGDRWMVARVIER